ncbi:hypothetical protein [uncultured Paraglaciecola sp.]|uniref:hypothetical protein n=1 Tax=uncultured Paraglaciecola sp. TaxID=1765024 RepID=UPI002615FC63|nr:hypothetical protein [uncultured Paraglaciecola sp.]
MFEQSGPQEETAGREASGVDAVVMAPVTGYVIYDVRVECPHCHKHLHLNQYPYNDDQTDYSLAEDELGEALFGYVDKPAKKRRT